MNDDRLAEIKVELTESTTPTPPVKAELEEFSQEKNTPRHFDPEQMALDWGSPFVSRDQPTLDRATGGILNARTLANLDCYGTGPPGRFKFGRKVAYPSIEFFRWFVKRIQGGQNEHN